MAKSGKLPGRYCGYERDYGCQPTFEQRALLLYGCEETDVGQSHHYDQGQQQQIFFLEFAVGLRLESRAEYLSSYDRKLLARAPLDSGFYHCSV